MLSTTQLSMSRVAKMPKWLMISALALLVAVGCLLLFLIALHSFALLVNTFGLSEADAAWVIWALLAGAGAAIDIAFPILIPEIGAIWWFIDEEDTLAAIDW